MSLFRAHNAEVLKLKRTLAFRVVFVLPLLIAVLQFFVILRTKNTRRDSISGRRTGRTRFRSGPCS